MTPMRGGAGLFMDERTRTKVVAVCDMIAHSHPPLRLDMLTESGAPCEIVRHRLRADHYAVSVLRYGIFVGRFRSSEAAKIRFPQAVERSER